MATATCTKCKETLPLDSIHFARNRSRKCGFSTTCKLCQSQYRVDHSETCGQKDNRIGRRPVLQLIALYERRYAVLSQHGVKPENVSWKKADEILKGCQG